MGSLGFHSAVARGTTKVPAVLGFENPKALGNAIHLYIERVIGLRKFGGAGLSALWTPKNFNPLVGGSHPTIMHQRSPRSTHPNKAHYQCWGSAGGGTWRPKK